VVDGFHRLAAARKLGWSHVSANVAKMTAPEARSYALLANTKHGRALSRFDKDRLFDLYVADGKHRGADGGTKSTRVIQVELNHIYSHETIRQKLKKRGIAMDVDVEFPGGFKPYMGGEPWDEEEEQAELGRELAESARSQLNAFGSLFFDLDDNAQRLLLQAARDLVDRLGRGERLAYDDEEDVEGLLDI
jgi:hypothetical protein